MVDQKFNIFNALDPLKAAWVRTPLATESPFHSDYDQNMSYVMIKVL